MEESTGRDFGEQPPRIERARRAVMNTRKHSREGRTAASRAAEVLDGGAAAGPQGAHSRAQRPGWQNVLCMGFSGNTYGNGAILYEYL